MFSNIFISGFVFSALGMLTGMIVTLGLRLIGKDIYKFIDNYEKIINKKLNQLR